MGGSHRHAAHALHVRAHDQGLLLAGTVEEDAAWQVEQQAGEARQGDDEAQRLGHAEAGEQRGSARSDRARAKLLHAVQGSQQSQLGVYVRGRSPQQPMSPWTK